uniref:Protein misato homolog 1 n=1 Tax=Petromyzon marinus TaxID=7757 RepID=A0AAJ7TUW4_PETMA|nr:protein misato homolog 1 [Petromyzon marinus]
MASSRGEVVTLQLGHYAGFVGAHWWNSQSAAFNSDPRLSIAAQEVNSDVLFREGVTLQGEPTYTPRLVLMDLKGNLSSLRQQGVLYEHPDQNTSTWSGKVSVHRTDPASRNAFLQDLDVIEEEWEKRTRASCSNAPKPETKNAPAGSAEPPAQKVYHLEEGVEVWSDFLRLHLHPRSVSLINDHTSDGDVDRFDVFGLGDSLLLRSPPVADDLEDRLHFFTEECDSLQGFQLLCDLHDGFSGLGARAVERLRDEYGTKGVLVWGLVPPAPPALSPLRSVYRLVNYALGMARLVDTASVLLPLSVSSVLSRRPSPPVVFPDLHYDAELHYHSSAVLAAAVGTSSLPYRTHSRLTSLSEFADSLSGGGRKVAMTSLALPFPLHAGESLPDALRALGAAPPWCSLAPGTAPVASASAPAPCCFAQSVVLRGVPAARHTAGSQRGSTKDSPLYRCSTGQDVMSAYLHGLYPHAPSAVQLLQAPMSAAAPFPDIFAPTVDRSGYLTDSRRKMEEAVSSVPVLTATQSGTALRTSLLALCRELALVDERRLPGLLAAGTEPGELPEALHGLRSLADAYHSGCGHEQNSDDDDDS